MIRRLLTTGLATLGILLSAAGTHAVAGAAPAPVSNSVAKSEVPRILGFWDRDEAAVAASNNIGINGPTAPPEPSKKARISHLPVTIDTDNSFHGRLLLRFPQGSGTCSATLIKTESMALAMTAAHCLFDPESATWASKVAFVPAYDRGRRPFGTFVALNIWVDGRFAAAANVNYDLGVVDLRANGKRRPGLVAGAADWTTGRSRSRQVEIHGYPAGKFDGEQRRCRSGLLRADWISRYFPGPRTIRANCNMARGSSGGGWMTEIKGISYLNGVTSYGTGGFRQLFSPYFGKAAARIIRLAEAG